MCKFKQLTRSQYLVEDRGSISHALACTMIPLVLPPFTICVVVPRGDRPRLFIFPSHDPWHALWPLSDCSLQTLSTWALRCHLSPTRKPTLSDTEQFDLAGSGLSGGNEEWVKGRKQWGSFQKFYLVWDSSISGRVVSCLLDVYRQQGTVFWFNIFRKYIKNKCRTCPFHTFMMDVWIMKRCMGIRVDLVNI